jgi:hypothetical protein
VDQYRFDADPDVTFHFDANPAPDLDPDPDPTRSLHTSESQNFFWRLLFTGEPFYFILYFKSASNILESI